MLYVAFTEVGMSQSHWSNGYQPKVNVLTQFTADSRESRWSTSAHYHYGADSSGSTIRSIPAEARFRYADISALTARADEISEACDIAIAAISRRIAGNLCAVL